MRCFGDHNPLYAKYHDLEWGVPSFNDRYLFEMLLLEGAQAGLSWETVLKKRKGYRELFRQFDPEMVAHMKDEELEALCRDPRIIRNRLKIFSCKKNAKVFLKIQKEWGSFSSYLWAFVDNTPVINKWKSLKDVPSRTEISDAISKDLKKRGMSFVGSTIIYAYLQAVGLVNDHLESCQTRQRSS